MGFLDSSNITSKKLRIQILWRILYAFIFMIVAPFIAILAIVNMIYQLITAKRDFWGGKIGDAVAWYVDMWKAIMYGA